ncbi:MAG TPA: deoxyribonuclease IV [Fimbriimonadaceae bacterium]|nr:deoxyribonuclease IV [Fimbriimonadaceae bacterium]
MIGASVSTRGGLPNGFKFAEQTGCEAIQLYVAPSRTWQIGDLPASVCREFRAAWSESKVVAVVAHASLLINLASVEADLRNKSIDRLAHEMLRCSLLGIDDIIVHPGSNPSNLEGQKLLGDSLDRLIKRTFQVRILLETAAGQGNSIGARLDELRNAMDSRDSTDRLGICLDTCHLFAAGYDIRGKNGYERVIAEVGTIVGLDRVKAIHVNDSQVELGRRVDRHSEFVGSGCIGIETFEALVRDPRFGGVPLIAEAPNTDTLTRPNVELLKRLRNSGL